MLQFALRLGSLAVAGWGKLNISIMVNVLEQATSTPKSKALSRFTSNMKPGTRNGLSAAFFNILLGLMMLVSPQSTSALTGDITHDPSKIVEKYLSLDSRGARLDARSFEVLQPYITWKEEPAWGSVVVISNYEVIDDVTQWEIINKLEALIPVTYQVVGYMNWETASFYPESHNETQQFHIKEFQNQWKIVAPLIRPHVGRNRLLDFVRLERLNEASEVKKAALRRLEEQLGKVK